MTSTESPTSFPIRARALFETGFKLTATGGTAEFLRKNGLEVERINKVMQGSPHIVDAMKDGLINLVINTTLGAQAIKDSFAIRQTALTMKIPYTTTIAASLATAKAISAATQDGLEVTPLQAYNKT